MSYLSRARKEDLIKLSDEIGITLPPNAKIIDITHLVTSAPTYDEQFTKNVLENIVSERLEKAAAEKENLAREIQLEKLKADNLDRQNGTPVTVTETLKTSDLTKLIKSFDANETDISTYLLLFERQAARVNINKSQYVTYLMGLLPLSIVQIIAQEPEQLTADYDFVKTLLLKRFKLSPEQFRQKFVYHNKERDVSWRDFAYQLNLFFEEWVQGLKITEFDKLKELMIVDQLKRKLPPDIRDHFIDDLHKITELQILIEKLETYETARIRIKKVENPNNNSRFTVKKFIPVKQNKEIPTSSLAHDNAYSSHNRNKFANMKCYTCNNYGHISSQCNQNIIKCRNCNKTGHKSHECTERKVLNHTIIKNSRIEKNIFIFNHEITCVCDTGSEITMCSDVLYQKFGSIPLKPPGIVLSGITNHHVAPLGYFNADIAIDNFTINANIFVMENMQFDFILGMDILNSLDVNFSNGKLIVNNSVIEKKVHFNSVTVCDKTLVRHSRQTVALGENQTSFLVKDTSFFPTRALIYDQSRKRNISPCSDHFNSNEAFSFLSQIANVIDQNEIDLSHIIDKNLREDLSFLINNYKPLHCKKANIQMHILLTDEIPIAHRARRLSFREKEIVENQIDTWLRDGVIRESVSDFCAPLVLCKKKDNSTRVCVDFRRLNKKIVRDRFPLPLMEDILDQLSEARIFSSLDLKAAFHHCAVAENSRKYTSFITHNGQYEFLKVPFGLANSPSVFQRYILHVFRDLLRDKTLVIYLDDIFIPAKDEAEGFAKLQRVLQTAAEYGLELNFKKCQFLQRSIECLGYIIENGIIRPSPSTKTAVQNFPQPKTHKQLMSFLGLTGYFRKFIPNYSTIAKPLSDLLRNNSDFKFDNEQKDAFQKLKLVLTNDPLLHLYRQNSELELHTDASSFGFGAVLLQKAENDKFYPIHYFSKKTTQQQEKYSSYELETLAIVEALKKFRSYLLGIKFKIVTDCSALQKTMHKKEIIPRIARWALYLEEFQYDIVHRPATQMRHVDALSRIVAFTTQHDEITMQIAAAQKNDDQIQTIKTLLANGDDNLHMVRNDILFRYDNGRDLLVVPEAMQTDIIKNVHSKGHYALAKTEEAVRKDFYIPGLRKKIENVLANCVDCILCNRKRGKKEGFLNPIPKEDVPLSTYHIDFIGPLPSTKKQYQHIFTIIDGFTKFVWLYPVKNTSTQAALEKLSLQQTTFGNPSRIVADRGGAFISHEFQDYCRDENIQLVHITTGIPRGNGQVERVHETLIPILTKLSSDNPLDWYKHVNNVQRFINSTISTSTTTTPFQLLIGTPMRNREDLRIKEILTEEYEKSFMKNREDLRQEAKQRILQIQDQNKTAHNKKCKQPHKYKKDDLVAIQRTQFGTGLKLRPKFHGPYKIVTVKRNDRYDVEKVGQHEGPNFTSSAADYMKPWKN